MGPPDRVELAPSLDAKEGGGGKFSNCRLPAWVTSWRSIVMGPSPLPSTPWHTAQYALYKACPCCKLASETSRGLVSSSPAARHPSTDLSYSNRSKPIGTLPAGGVWAVSPSAKLGFG